MSAASVLSSKTQDHFKPETEMLGNIAPGEATQVRIVNITIRRGPVKIELFSVSLGRIRE